MKIRHHTIAALAVWSGLAGNFALAQDVPAVPPSSAKATAEASSATKRWVQAADLLQQSALSQDGQPAFLNQFGGSELTLTSGDFRYDGFGGTLRPRTLVIRSADLDQKAQSNLEEDLNVMSRIFAKALKEKGGDEDALTAMGMKIRTLSISGQSGIQNMYLDGYGALFLMSVRFPLLPQPEAPEKEASKEPADSTWEEAKRELYGPKETGANVRTWEYSSNKPREEYDAKKVAKLKESLLHALKNATNIRKLKSDDFITVAVAGADNVAVRTWALPSVYSSPERRKETELKDNVDRNVGNVVVRRGVRDVRGASGGETTMTIRVKKSDVDAFAKGSLTFEDFQKKASIATY
jgi:hypothetical protein